MGRAAASGCPVRGNEHGVGDKEDAFTLSPFEYRHLNERINAIDELLRTENPKKAQVVSLLKHLPDLEKGLSRIHYGRVIATRRNRAFSCKGYSSLSLRTVLSF